METEAEKRNIAGRLFRVVDRGLDEREVSTFIEELIKKLRAAERTSAVTDGTHFPESDRLIRMVSEEARQIRADAETEATRIIAEAEALAEEQTESARKITKATAAEAKRILEKSRAQADWNERVARRKAEQMVDSFRRKMMARVPRSLRTAQQAVIDELENLRSEAESLGSDLSGT
jgi:vacuolar-type H+-ATPase subunit H